MANRYENLNLDQIIASISDRLRMDQARPDNNQTIIHLAQRLAAEGWPGQLGMATYDVFILNIRVPDINHMFLLQDNRSCNGLGLPEDEVRQLFSAVDWRSPFDDVRQISAPGAFGQPSPGETAWVDEAMKMIDVRLARQSLEAATQHPSSAKSSLKRI